MKVVCFGDSLTACGGEEGRFSDILQDRFPGHVFVNRGVGGDSLLEARERFFSDVLAERSDVVLFELGANDWWRDERPYTAWAADLDHLVASVHQAGAQPVILGVFGHRRSQSGDLIPKEYGIDGRAVAFREQEESIARRYNCPYIPNIQADIIDNRRCWLDRNHPNEYGNRFVANQIELVLEDILKTHAVSVRRPTLETTRDFWDEAVCLAPDRLAVVEGDRRFSYRQAGEMVERLAAGLHTATGVVRPRVAVYLPNSLDYYLLYWAVQRLGGVIVPLNTWLRTDSLAGIFESIKPHVLLVRGPQDQAVLDVARQHPDVKVFSVDRASGLACFADLLEATGQAPPVPLGGDDLSIVMHTSGTTSAPKGAMMRHSDLMFNVCAAINAHSFNPSDIHLLVNPMFHCTALYSSLTTAAYQKAPIVIVSTTDPAPLLETVQRERITTFLSVPAVFQKVLSLKTLDRYDLTSLRVMAFAGSPMPVPTIHELRRCFPDVALHNFFGLTETISMTHVLRNDDVENHADSVGRLLPFVESIVVDDENKSVPAGMPGELLFAREEVIPGYFNQPGRLEEALVDIDGRQWFRTGDLATIDEEGFFVLKGRKKDMIIVGGENVFAAEVEAVLMSHEKVAEAAVKGVPATGARTHLGELVKAYVVRKDPALTEADLRRHCFERLPSYKAPAYFQFMDTLPRNPAGKVVKDDLS
jgi:fatty-acyl-CoA synthase